MPSASLPFQLKVGASLTASGTQKGPLPRANQQFLTGKWPEGSLGINYWETIPERGQTLRQFGSLCCEGAISLADKFQRNYHPSNNGLLACKMFLSSFHTDNFREWSRASWKITAKAYLSFILTQSLISFRLSCLISFSSINYCYLRRKLVLVLNFKVVQNSLEKIAKLWSENTLELGHDHSTKIITIFLSEFSLSHFPRPAYGYLCIHSSGQKTDVNTNQI